MSLEIRISTLASEIATDIKSLRNTKQPLDADLTAIAGLTGTSGVLTKTAADTWTLDTSGNSATATALQTPRNINGVPFDGTADISIPGTGGASQRVVSTHVATAGQTIFNTLSGYTLGYLDVYLNGVKLILGSDYSASDGTTAVLSTGALIDDTVELVAYSPVGLTDGYTKPEADAKFATLDGVETLTNKTLTNPVYTGTLTGGTGVVNLGSGQFVKDASGNIGLGATPNFAMMTYRAGATGTYHQFGNGLTGAGAANGMLVGVDAAGDGTIDVRGTQRLRFAVAGAYRAEIDSSGNLAGGGDECTQAHATKIESK